MNQWMTSIEVKGKCNAIRDDDGVTNDVDDGGNDDDD